MHLNEQARELVLGAAEWVTVLLPSGFTVTVQGTGEIYDDDLDGRQIREADKWEHRT